MVVVGAGPAGAFLAYLLASVGCRVTIIDKAVFPRDKVCGGGLSHKTLQLLPFDVGVNTRYPVLFPRGAQLAGSERVTVAPALPAVLTVLCSWIPSSAWPGYTRTASAPITAAASHVWVRIFREP